jgi:hypothetical protein
MSEKKNIKALRPWRLMKKGADKAVNVAEGEVVAKSDFPDPGEWRNLVHMKPAKAEETSDPVGKPKSGGKKAAGLPSA